MKQVKPFIDRLPELHPIPTGLSPQIKIKNKIKAILFDIYGTLLISSSGTIHATTSSIQHLKTAMELSGIKDELGTAGNSMEFYQNVIEYFNDRILKLNKAKKAAGISHPEIEIREVWSEVFKRLRKEYEIPVPDPAAIQSFILVYEILNNPVYPMPAMIEILTKIHASGLPMGIISDAQFFTPVIMNYFLTGHLEHTEYIPYFRKELTVFSYKVYRVKPDPRLFDHAQSVLDRKFGIARSNVLYIGNDMLKDILPAQKAGFKTALFAGDQRSLRLRDHDALVKGIHPDYIVTHLQQIRDLL